jgi:hypothetical protein
VRIVRGCLLAAAIGSALGTGAAPTVELVFYGLVLTVLFLVAFIFVAQPRRGALSAERTPTRPPAPPRLVPIGGCRDCGASIGAEHRDCCPMCHAGPGPTPFVTESDCRHLTAGDMGMG